MTLYNEMTMNKADGSGSRVYLDADMEPYINGTKKAADWNSLVFSDWSPQTQHDVSISGGGDDYQYYVSMGYLFQEGSPTGTSTIWNQEPALEHQRQDIQSIEYELQRQRAWDDRAHLTPTPSH